jgi:hypothetical protein
MCAQESTLHTYRIEYGYRNTNVTIYIIYYRIMSYKRLSQTLLEASQQKDTITPQAITHLEHHIIVLQSLLQLLSSRFE